MWPNTYYVRNQITHQYTRRRYSSVPSQCPHASETGARRIWNGCKMHLKRVQTCLKWVQDTSRTCTRCICPSAKPCDKAAVRRTWVPRPFLPDRDVGCVWNACRTRLVRMRMLPWSWAAVFSASLKFQVLEYPNKTENLTSYVNSIASDHRCVGC